MLTTILVPIVLMALIFALLNVPLYAIILTAALYLQYFINDVPLAAVFTGMVESITKTSLMAVPFFVLAGGLIQASSLGTRLITVFAVTLQNIRGGLSIACLLSNAFFGAISGSAPAAVATFSKIIYVPMEKAYGERLSLGMLTSSGALSTIIPPSITMIIFGVATETSVADLFMCGIFPGLLIVVVVATYLFIKGGTNTAVAVTGDDGKTPLPSMARAWFKGIPVLVLPVLILGGIYSGVCTPTEAGAIAALYGLIVPIIFLRDISVTKVPAILLDSIKITAQIFILVAASITFAQAATMAQLPQLLYHVLSDLNYYTFFLFLNVLLLIVGCFFEPGAAVLILAPLLLPTARALGIDLLHLGIVFTVNLSIGMFTPPFGLNIFVVQSVLKKSAGIVARSVGPFIAMYILCLLAITYIPQIALFLPRLMH